MSSEVPSRSDISKRQYLFQPSRGFRQEGAGSREQVLHGRLKLRLSSSEKPRRGQDKTDPLRRFLMYILTTGQRILRLDQISVSEHNRGFRCSAEKPTGSVEAYRLAGDGLYLMACLRFSTINNGELAHGTAIFRIRFKLVDVLQQDVAKISRSKTQLVLKAYTTKAGDGNADGNIIIHTDQYNKDDFPVEYMDAKFFVIKSYSEDDVHKSIKYNVWSSTPNGNKKLNIAYEDAQRIVLAKSRSCPVFLFFSVNASGQFCGVAEMIGPVDFNRDMDFWQQDKWSGSFPVKWHIIKDVPNNNFRHVILENNENKPVTNSRDTQELPFIKGLEMIKLFKNHTLKTSLLDDFIYYENRQKIMQEEKARLVVRRLERPYFVPALDQTRQLNCVVEQPLREDKNLNKANDGARGSERNATSRAEQVYSNPGTVAVKESPKLDGEEKADVTSTLRMESLELGGKVVEKTSGGGATPAAASDTNSKPTEVVTVGSMPIKVNGYNTETRGVLTVGTIPLDPKALQLDNK
ncbi:YTH domain-containing family protein 2, partial [Cucurbita argyrosperma subsp. argyrosperma]